MLLYSSIDDMTRHEKLCLMIRISVTHCDAMRCLAISLLAALRGNPWLEHMEERMTLKDLSDLLDYPLKVDQVS